MSNGSTMVLLHNYLTQDLDQDLSSPSSLQSQGLATHALDRYLRRYLAMQNQKLAHLPCSKLNPPRSCLTCVAGCGIPFDR